MGLLLVFCRVFECSVRGWPRVRKVSGFFVFYCKSPGVFFGSKVPGFESSFLLFGFKTAGVFGFCQLRKNGRGGRLGNRLAGGFVCFLG